VSGPKKQNQKYQFSPQIMSIAGQPNHWVLSFIILTCFWTFDYLFGLPEKMPKSHIEKWISSCNYWFSITIVISFSFPLECITMNNIERTRVHILDVDILRGSRELKSQKHSFECVLTDLRQGSKFLVFWPNYPSWIFLTTTIIKNFQWGFPLVALKNVCKIGLPIFEIPME